MTPSKLFDEQGRWLMPRRPIPKRDEGIAKVVEREQRQVRLPTAKADAILPAPLLQKKLGRSTFRLWAVLLTLRNEECETHPSVPGLVKATGLGLEQVRKSLVRLREFKLVEDKGVTYLRVPCRCAVDLGPHLHKVYLRKVYGTLKASPDLQTQSALVPRETARLVKEAAGQGGVRAGAGRPKGKLDSAPRQTIKCLSRKSNIPAYKYQEPISSESLSDSLQKCGVSLRVAVKDTEKAGKERKNPLRYPLPILLGSFTPSHEEDSVPTPTQPSESAAAPARPVQASTPPASAAQAATAKAWADGVEVDLLDVVAGSGTAKCITFGGNHTGPRQRYTSEDMRAATELSNQIKMLVVPPPPKLTEDDSEEVKLALLKQAYRAAHERVLRTEFWRRNKSQTPKERAALLEAAGALLAEGITPMAWARFSFYQWTSVGKKTAPGTRWVWSAQRIHEHAGWCHEAVGSLNTGKRVQLPAATELLRRLATIRSRLGFGRPTSEVVSEVLPERERQVLLAQQERQLEAGRQDIERRLHSGEWMWG